MAILSKISCGKRGKWSESEEAVNVKNSKFQIADGRNTTKM